MTKIPLLVFGIAVTLAAAAGLTQRDDDGASRLRVGWGGSEGRPSCAYDATARTVAATIIVRGNAPRPDRVTVTVAAYADENTSRQVGTASRSLPVHGIVHTRLAVTVPVTRPPHIGEDDVVACRLAARSQHNATLPLF